MTCTSIQEKVLWRDEKFYSSICLYTSIHPPGNALSVPNFTPITNPDPHHLSLAKPSLVAQHQSAHHVHRASEATKQKSVVRPEEKFALRGL
jgi:hypothetical protein